MRPPFSTLPFSDTRLRPRSRLRSRDQGWQSFLSFFSIRRGSRPPEPAPSGVCLSFAIALWLFFLQRWYNPTTIVPPFLRAVHVSLLTPAEDPGPHRTYLIFGDLFFLLTTVGRIIYSLQVYSLPEARSSNGFLVRSRPAPFPPRGAQVDMPLGLAIFFLTFGTVLRKCGDPCRTCLIPSPQFVSASKRMSPPHLFANSTYFAYFSASMIYP